MPPAATLEAFFCGLETYSIHNIPAISLPNGFVEAARVAALLGH